MRIKRGNTIIFYLVAFATYIFLLWYSIDFCYFGDNVQQIAVEAKWIYGDGTSSLLRSLPIAAESYPCSGYQMPTVGFTTAILWRIFGCHLWVSHAYMFLWAIVFIIAVKYIVNAAFDSIYSNLIGWILIFQPCVVSQFMVASPDFILLATFALAFYAIGDHKPWIFCFALLALSIVSLRGLFMALCMAGPAIYYTAVRLDNSFSAAFRTIGRMCLPALFVSIVYYTYYFIVRDFPDVSAFPDGFWAILNNLKSLAINIIGSGRALLWILTILIVAFAIWRQTKQTLFERTMMIFTQQTIVIYVFLTLLTTIVFSERFFMPMTFALTFFVLSYVVRWLERHFAQIIICLVLASEMLCYVVVEDDGTQQWDCSPLHVGYYEVREQVLDYIEQHNIDGANVRASKGFDQDPAIVSLEPNRPFLRGDNTAQYFLYSNISKISEIELADYAKSQRWHVECEFTKGAVTAILYRRNN